LRHSLLTRDPIWLTTVKYNVTRPFVFLSHGSSHQHTGKGRDRIRTSDILIYAGLKAAIIYYPSWEHAFLI
jgi:hypothetical protein